MTKIVNFLYNSYPGDEVDWAEKLRQEEARKAFQSEVSKRNLAASKAEKTKQWKKDNPVAADIDRLQGKFKRVSTRFSKSGTEVGKSFGGFVKQGAMAQPPSFSQEQDMLRQMFGGGDKVWATPDSETKVTINHDLNPSLRGDVGTAELFGFGGRSERSGLF